MRQAGQQIRGYVLKERIGAGGMGEVWLVAKLGAHSFTKNLCIKTMLPEAAAFLDYFVTEARLGGRLAHSNLVNVFDFFEEAGEHFIVMEYVEGLNLHALLDKEPRLTPHVACYIAWSALKGLHFAHTAALGGPNRGGLVHRDISPDNILITPDGEVKVTDFGVAQLEVEWRKKTQAENAFRGKPVYASPEMFRPPVDAEGRALPLDARADVYQVGAVLYQMLTGRPAFGAASSIYELSVRISEGRIVPLRDIAPDVTPAIATVVGMMMHHDREHRYASAQTARVALFQSCPDLAMADQPLAEKVRFHTRSKRRYTSPYIRPEDMPHVRLDAPPHLGGGGVVLEGHADAETVKVGIATAAQILKTPKLIEEEPTRDPNAPAAPVLDGNSTEILRPASRPRLKRPMAMAGAAVLAALAVSGLVLVVNSNRRSAEIAISRPVAAPAPAEAPPKTPAPPPPPEATQPVAAPPATAQPVPALGNGAQPTLVRAAAVEQASAPAVPLKPHHHHRSADDAAPPTGRIVVHREGEPIRVYVDGVYVGKAPIKYEVEPGTHKVKLERQAGLGAIELPVKVEAGHDYPLNAGSP